MACPGAQQLEALLRNQVTPRAEAELSAHLESCGKCRERLEALAGGASLIPRPEPKSSGLSSTPFPALAQAIRNLRRLQPASRSGHTAETPDPSADVTTIQSSRSESFKPTVKHSVRPREKSRAGSSRQKSWWRRPL